MTDPRIEKLPKWVKALLAHEIHRANRAEDALAKHLKTVEQTRISYGDYDNPVYIPENGLQTIKFDLGQDRRDKTYDEINVGLRKDQVGGGLHLEIMAGHSIVVEPVVSNVVRIMFRE